MNYLTFLLLDVIIIFIIIWLIALVSINFVQSCIVHKINIQRNAANNIDTCLYIWLFVRLSWLSNFKEALRISLLYIEIQPFFLLHVVWYSQVCGNADLHISYYIVGIRDISIKIHLILLEQDTSYWCYFGITYLCASN